MTNITNVKGKRNSVSKFLLSLAFDRDLCKSDYFTFCSMRVHRRVNEGEFPTAEILSPSNTGSVPTETPKHRFPGILPARKQVLILLAGMSHVYAAMFLCKYN